VKEVDERNIYDLPVHDSDFLGINISQNVNGNTDVTLSIVFCEGELEDLVEYIEVIKPNGFTSFVFKNCELIKLNTICNRAQRDSIDYIQFLDPSSNPKELSSKRGKNTLK
jgi:hypothetical protein